MITVPVLTDIPARHKNEPCCTVLARPGLSAERSKSLADRLKAVADPTRLGLLDLLTQQTEPICVCDLTPRFPQNQPTISHHLKLLRAAGLIDTEKRGIWSYYWATEEGRRTLSTISTLG